MNNQPLIQINDVVKWVECPVKGFDTSRVHGISPDGSQVLLGFIHHPVSVAEIEPCSDPVAVEFWGLYKPATENQWTEK